MLENSKLLLSKKARKILDAFQPPATPAEIEELEKTIDCLLPEDFKSLYLECNGFNKNMYANLFYGYPFSSIEDILSYISIFADNEPIKLRYADNEIKDDYTYGRKRIPIGDDGGTTYLCMDLDPSENGQYGQIILLDYKMNVAIKLNNSLREMVLQFEKDLSAEKYSLSEDALGDGVHWLEPVKEIDPVNWYNSPTWEHIKSKI